MAATEDPPGSADGTHTPRPVPASAGSRAGRPREQDADGTTAPAAGAVARSAAATTGSSDAEPAGFEEHVRARLAELKPSERTVAHYMLANPSEVLFATAGDLGGAAGTSDATVVRTAKALGYAGLPELKWHLGQQFTRLTPPADRLTTRVSKVRSAEAAPVEQVTADAVERLRETERSAVQAEFDAVVEALLGARSVFAWGLGVAGLAAEYAATRLGRLGLLTRHSADTGFRLADPLLPLTGEDVVLVFSPGRHNRDLETVLTHAAEQETPVVLISGRHDLAPDPRVRWVLTAPNSPAKLSGELLTATAVVDTLALTVAERTGERAERTASRLTWLRTELERSEVPRARRPRES